MLVLQLSSPLPSGQNLEYVVNGVLQNTVTVGAAGSAPVPKDSTVLVEGSVITALGSPGAVVQVIDAQDRILGAGIVNAQGQVSIPVSGATAGEQLKLVQNGVAVNLPQPALILGSARVFTNTNIFNPARGASLNIGFKAVADERLTVKVFNLEGELVRLVEVTDVETGQLYQAVWDGRNQAGEMVASGVYIVSVYGPNTRILKKVIVLK